MKKCMACIFFVFIYINIDIIDYIIDINQSKTVIKYNVDLSILFLEE